MSAHFCIGNPCWICFPKYAPERREPDRIVWKPLDDEKAELLKRINRDLSNSWRHIFRGGGCQ